MARIYIDPHMFSEDWFKKTLPELVKVKSVIFVFGHSEKHLTERQKARKCLEFYKALKGQKNDGVSRVLDVSSEDLSKHEEFLKLQSCFSNCPHCDDPHIFALVYVKPTPYIFSMDARIAKCRGVINQNIENRYCQFSLIQSHDIYHAHKSAIHS